MVVIITIEGQKLLDLVSYRSRELNARLVISYTLLISHTTTAPATSPAHDDRRRLDAAFFSSSFFAAASLSCGRMQLTLAMPGSGSVLLGPW